LAIGPTQFSLLTAIALVTIATLFVLLGGRAGGKRISHRDVISAVVFVATAGVLTSLVMWLFFGFDRFGAAHVLYVTGTVAVPGTAAMLILVPLLPGTFRVFPNSTPGGLILSTLLLIPGGLGFYASHVEPFQMGTNTVVVPVPAVRTGQQAVRVGVLSDIQNNRVGAHEWDAVREIMLEKPDIILFAGDLFQGDDAEFDENVADFRELMAQLSAPLGVYAVRGNTEEREQMEEMLRGTGVNFLFNDEVQLQKGRRTITLAGTDYHLSYRQPQELIDNMERPGSDDIRILLSHTPDVLELVQPNTRIDLVVSGHTHGGQIALPIIGPVFDNVEVPRSVSGGGLSRYQNKRIYVSTGVGMERRQAPQVRFGVPPRVDLLVFR